MNHWLHILGFPFVFFFFSDLRPCGGRCLSMPFVSCYANHRTMYERLGDWDPVTFCQDGCFFGRSAGEWGRTQRGVNARHWPCGTCLQMVARLMQTGVPFRSDPVLRDIVLVCHDAMEKLSPWKKPCSGIKKASKSCEDWRKTQIWIHLGPFGDLGLGRVA